MMSRRQSRYSGLNSRQKYVDSSVRGFSRKFVFSCSFLLQRAPYDQVNRLICHPTLPLTITAHEDRNIRFFDNTTGKMIHWMVAHLDAVTSLAIDPSGLFLLSGSKYCHVPRTDNSELYETFVI